MNKIAFVVGHDHKEQGAFSKHLNRTEFLYHLGVADYLPFDVYWRNPNINGYKSKMQDLAKQINGKGYTAVVELHFNSATPTANGCEALFFGGSVIGKKWAQTFVEKTVKEYGTRNRGVLAVTNDKQRGYWFLKLIDAPAIILEPFFGSNPESLKFLDEEKYAKHLLDIFC